jgi:hypothetical protein
VVLVSAEDRPETTIKPRLVAMGANIDRITIVKAKYILREPGKRPVVHPATLQDLGYWHEVFARIKAHIWQDATLFIVDPIPSYLGRGVNDAKNTELRAVLEPFVDSVIAPRNIAFVANTHLNKSIDQRTPVHRITGSVAYANIPRNVHIVARDPDNPERRFFKQVKTNDSPDTLALAFTIESIQVTCDNGEVTETVQPVFEANGVEINLAEVVAGEKRKRGPAPSRTREIAEWLFDYLSAANPPIPWFEVVNAAGAKGFIGEFDPIKNDWTQMNTLYRAKDLIRDLDGARSGKEVEKFRTDCERNGSVRSYVHWQLIDRTPGSPALRKGGPPRGRGGCSDLK